MQTNVDIDDVALRRAIEMAAKSGCTLNDVINEALAAWLESCEVTEPPFETTTYGAPGRVDHEPADFAVALDAEDAQQA